MCCTFIGGAHSSREPRATFLRKQCRDLCIIVVQDTRIAMGDIVVWRKTTFFCTLRPNCKIRFSHQMTLLNSDETQKFRGIFTILVADFWLN